MYGYYKNQTHGEEEYEDKSIFSQLVVLDYFGLEIPATETSGFCSIYWSWMKEIHMRNSAARPLSWNDYPVPKDKASLCTVVPKESSSYMKRLTSRSVDDLEELSNNNIAQGSCCFFWCQLETLHCWHIHNSAAGQAELFLYYDNNQSNQ